MKIIILAGGRGNRLWPASRKSLPKQFLHFIGDQTLLQSTLKRFLKNFNWRDFLIVTHCDYLEIVRQQVQSVNPSLAEMILVEPQAKNTAPAINLAVKFLQEKLGAGKEEPFLVAPSDHMMSPEEAFLSVLPSASKACQSGAIVLFGINPRGPEVGYGYIKTGKEREDGLSEIIEFVEKPNLETALRFQNKPDYLWNSGIFMSTIGIFTQQMRLHCPETAQFFDQSYEEILQEYEQVPEISIDCALMEKTNLGRLLKLDLLWSDLGSWDSVYEMLEKDENLNVKVGKTLALDTKKCLIMGSKKLISTIGLEDMLIVETEDAILIGKKGESQKIKKLLEQMKNTHFENHL